MDEVLVPLVAILCVFGLPVGAFIIFRVLAHRERMEMIRYGIAPPGTRMGAARYANPPPNVGSAPVESFQDGSVLLRKGVLLAFVGMALTIGLGFIGYHSGGEETRVGNVVVRESSHFDFGPWLLGGLIPLFIGLSQIVMAFLTEPQLFARFRGLGASGGPAGPGPRYPDPPPQETATSDGPYTYRPGGRQELRPPTSPPRRP